MPVVKLDYLNTKILDSTLEKNSLDKAVTFTANPLTLATQYDVLFKFDMGLIPNNAIINSAKLSVTTTTAFTQYGSLPVAYKILNEWEPVNLTYSKLQVDTVPYETGAEIFTGGVTAVLDVTTIAQSWVSEVNNGMVLKTKERENGQIVSSTLISSGAKHTNSPTLTIDYSIPTEDKQQVEFVGKIDESTTTATNDYTHNLPASNVDDLLITFIAYNTATIPVPPTGWHVLATESVYSTSNQTILYKRSDGVESSMNVKFSAVSDINAVTLAFRNVKILVDLGPIFNNAGVASALISPRPINGLPKNGLLLISNVVLGQAGVTPPINFSELSERNAASKGVQIQSTYNYQKESYSSAETGAVLGTSVRWATKSLFLVPITNEPPKIDGQDEDLGAIDAALLKAYTVTDTEGETITITEKVNGTALRTYEGTGPQTLDLSTVWASLAVGKHTVTIEANDTYDVTRKSVRTWTFLKILNSNDDLLTNLKGLVDLVPHLKSIKQMLVDKVGGSATDTFEDIIEVAELGKKHARLLINSAVGSKSFPTYNGGSVTMNYVAVDLSLIGFVPSRIILRRQDTTGLTTTTWFHESFYSTDTNTSVSTNYILKIPYVNGVIDIAISAGTNTPHIVDIYE